MQLIPDNTIYQYVRNRRGERVGVVLAVKREDETVGFGHSLCAIKLGDTFNLETAFKIALGRAESYPHISDEVPRSAKDSWISVQDRAVRYFK